MDLTFYPFDPGPLNPYDSLFLLALATPAFFLLCFLLCVVSDFAVALKPNYVTYRPLNIYHGLNLV